MLKTKILASVLCICVTISSLVDGRFLDQDEDFRVKRQTADMRLSELQTLREILDRIPKGCSQFACGVVDIFRRYEKRSWSDQRIAELKAKLGLKHPGYPIAHGLFDPYKIFVKKRTSSDQRIAELQALIALVHGLGNVAHGQLDPSLIGRRKRGANLLKTSATKQRLMRGFNLNKETAH